MTPFKVTFARSATAPVAERIYYVVSTGSTQPGATMFAVMQTLVDELFAAGRRRTAENYRAALNSFRRYRRGIDIAVADLDALTAEDFERWHRGRGTVPNTISFYNRILRAAYNRAAARYGFENRHPFRGTYTGIDKTVKRALPIAIIRRIRQLDLSATPALEYARDIFMLSFYLRGMSFIDMAYLRRTDLHYGSVTYRRRKTGQPLVIQWTPEMQAILDKYPPAPSPYLLPILRHPDKGDHSSYRNIAYNINRSLKTIAAMVGAPIALTMYVARHSWASAAKAKGIPLGVISEGLGHDSEATTRIYLASLDTSVINKANSLIIASL